MAPPARIEDPQYVEPDPRSFRWLLASTFVSAVGRNGYHIACAWILVVHGLGPAVVAAFFAIISVTELFTSPLAGWIADRYDRRYSYIAADIVRLVGALTLAVLMIVVEPRWAILVSATLFATADRIALTSSQSMIPTVGGRLSLPTANSLFFFLMQAGSLVAAGLTGLLLHISTPTLAFVVLAIAFALSVCFMLAVRRELCPHSSSRIQQGPGLAINAQSLQVGAIYALLYTGGVLVSVIGPSFVFDELAGNAIDFGYLESAWSAGSIVGALLLIPLVRAVRISDLQFVILVLTVFAFAILKVLNLPWVLTVFVVLGGLYNLGRVGIEVMLQSFVPPMALGRAKGVLHSVGVLLGVILFGVVAIVGDKVQPSTIFLAFAALLALGTLALMVCPRVAARVRKARNCG
jgi:MFS family permease